MANPFEIVSKLGVARRQLRTAIRMFFERRDPISVHTLAAAAHQVLFDLLSAHGLDATSTVLMNPGSPYIREEKKKEWLKITRSAQNFFKHASSDPNTTYKFYPDATQFYLFDAATMYRRLTTEPLREVNLFQAWFYLKYPDLLVEERLKEAVFHQKRLRVDPNDFDVILYVLDHPGWE